MKKYEYTIVTSDCSKMEPDGLKDIGLAGWELITVLQHGFQHRWYFKREKK